MKFRFENEGSRGEVDITFGGIVELDKLVERYVSERENLLVKEDGNEDYVNEFMEMEFGGITEDCFVEISFGEEDSYMVFLLNDDGSIDSDTYNVEGYIDYGSEEEGDMRYEYQLNYRLPSGSNLVVDKDTFSKMEALVA